MHAPTIEVFEILDPPDVIPMMTMVVFAQSNHPHGGFAVRLYQEGVDDPTSPIGFITGKPFLDKRHDDFYWIDVLMWRRLPQDGGEVWNG